nr:hypothetical protein BaRGS_032162 [Batillaria attramentaria]
MKEGVLAAFILLTLLSGTHGESANTYPHRDPPSNSSCPEPGPVANAYRRFDDKGNVKYACYHGYKLTNGNDTRKCQADTDDDDDEDNDDNNDFQDDDNGDNDEYDDDDDDGDDDDDEYDDDDDDDRSSCYHVSQTKKNFLEAKASLEKC